MPRILDNHPRHRSDPEHELRAALHQSLADASRLDACVGYFNLRGWDQVAEAVDGLAPANDDDPKARVLIGVTPAAESAALRRSLASTSADQSVDNATAARLKTETVAALRSQLTWGVPTDAHEAALRTLRRQLVRGDVRVKLHTAYQLHAKLYLCVREHADSPITSYVGSSNLTMAGLVRQGELNVDLLDHDSTRKLQAWFDERWNDRFSIDVTDELIDLLAGSWASEAPIDPYLVYLKLAYHLSREAREGISPTDLPQSLRDKLLRFQEFAVGVASRILLREGGVMLGDVVGLGKTLTATAVARLMADVHGLHSTMVICPKNLVPMWQRYMDDYEINNARVQSLSTVQRDLPDLRRYRLVIVDESHNLRNSDSKRHQAIKDYVDANDSLVVLLSATPYSKHYMDVANQLALFVHPDRDLGVQPLAQMKIDGAAEFHRRCGGRTSTLGAFLQSEQTQDWQTLMAQFMVRRTRAFIEQTDALTDADGRKYLLLGDAGERFYFPTREPRPISFTYAPDDPGKVMVSDDTLDEIKSLHLPRYDLAQYLRKDAEDTAADADAIVIGNLMRASRGNLHGFALSVLYKRLSSSAWAFVLTLRGHLERNATYLYAIENNLPLPLGTIPTSGIDTDEDPDRLERTGVTADEGIETDESWTEATHAALTDVDGEAMYEAMQAKQSTQIDWINSAYFTDELREHLEADVAILRDLLRKFGVPDPAKDTKLDELLQVLNDEHGDTKVLVFTEYADTADYLLRALRPRMPAGRTLEMVSGRSGNPTAVARRFSPVSNLVPADETIDEIDVLISTDVLSEGQNLQDAHVVVNFDLPWAIIKVIQRAGRVDRIGQQSETVYVHSFEPDEGVEEVIVLRERIRQRLEQFHYTFGGDEALFGDPGERHHITDIFTGKLVEDADIDVDWLSRAAQIWNEAKRQYPDHCDLAEELPDVVFATRAGQAPPAGGSQPVAQSGENSTLAYVQMSDRRDRFGVVDSARTIQLVGPLQALDWMRCEPDEPAREHHARHFDDLRALVDEVHNSQPRDFAGALAGLRRRLFTRLNELSISGESTLLLSISALRRAVDDIIHYPLTARAEQELRGPAQTFEVEDLAEAVVSLYESGTLCSKPADNTSPEEIQIMCSMGYIA